MSTRAFRCFLRRAGAGRHGTDTSRLLQRGPGHSASGPRAATACKCWCGSGTRSKQCREAIARRLVRGRRAIPFPRRRAVNPATAPLLGEPPQRAARLFIGRKPVDLGSLLDASPAQGCETADYRRVARRILVLAVVRRIHVVGVGVLIAPCPGATIGCSIGLLAQRVALAVAGVEAVKAGLLGGCACNSAMQPVYQSDVSPVEVP